MSIAVRVSEHETPITLQLRDHWEAAGLWQKLPWSKRALAGWTTGQVRRLAKMTGLTPHELGALAAVPPDIMSIYLKQGRVPPTVALHFMQFEAFFLEAYLNRPAALVVPMNLAFPPPHAA